MGGSSRRVSRPSQAEARCPDEREREAGADEWVKKKVLDAFNVEYVHITELDIKQRTCVEQLYSHTMNGLRTNILRRNPQFQHASLVRKEQPKVLGFFKKHFKRSKTTFFVTQNETDVHSWCKVRQALHYLGKGSHYWQLTTVRSGEL
jgi:hypothetical protein